MRRSRSQLDAYHTRHLSWHKPGVMPKSSQNLSPISSDRHRYELKQRIWPKKTVESWFADHTTDDRRAVYSFLNALYDEDDQTRFSNVQRRKSPSRVHTPVIHSPAHPLQRRMSNNSRQESRASKRDLGEILDSLESFRPSLSSQDKGIQTSATPLTVVLPNVNGVKDDDQKIERQSKRPVTSTDKYTETIQPLNTINDEDDTKSSRRYLSHTWRVINPREDPETNVRPENNRSSFFNFTKKVYPEYFFIHPEWY